MLQKWYRVAMYGLIGFVVAAVLGGGGYAAYRHNYEQRREAWLREVETKPYEAVSIRDVKRYGEHARPKTKTGPLLRAKYSWRLPMAWENGPACWADGTTTGNGWSCTLAIFGMDTLISPIVDASNLPSASASSGGGSGSMYFVKVQDHFGPGLEPIFWTPEQRAAWREWAAGLPENQYEIHTYLYAATVSVGSGDGGLTDSVYKVFGYYDEYIDGAYQGNVWVGDTEWSLPFSSSITGIKPKVKAAVQSSTKYTSPRKVQDRQVTCELYTTGETIRTATLGGMSLSAPEELPTGENGKILPEAGIGGVGGMFFNCSLACTAPEMDTSYCEVQGVTCSTKNVPVNLAASFWSARSDENGQGWVDIEPTLTKPENAVWRAFSDGNTFKLHRVGAGNKAAITMSTIIAGPTRWNINAGRFAPKMSLTDHPLPTAPGAPADDPPSLGVQAGAWRVDVGLRYAQDEDPAHDQTIWLGQGLSDYYTWSRTTLPDGSYLRTGTYSFPNDGMACIVDPKWLEYSGELCEFQAVDDEGKPISAVIDNSRAKIAMQSLAGSLDSEEPYWGPAIKYLHRDVSADIPPGYETRPSKWFLNGVELTELDPDNGELLITINDSTDRLTRTLLSRKSMRFDYLCQWEQGKTGYEYPCNADWPLINKANYAGAGDTPAMIRAIPVEDVVNYDNSRLLVWTFGKRPTVTDWTEARLTLDFSHYDFIDDSYTPANYRPIFRFGADSFFPDNYSVSESSFTFDGKVHPINPQAPLGPNTLAFDLAQLLRSNDVHLQHVDGVRLTGLQPGVYTLTDVRLAKNRKSFA